MCLFDEPWQIGPSRVMHQLAAPVGDDRRRRARCRCGEALQRPSMETDKLGVQVKNGSRRQGR